MRLTPVLLLGAIGASAHPSLHGAHQHRALHEHRAEAKRDTIVVATIYGKVVSWTQGDSPFVAAQKPTSAAPTSTTSTVVPVVPTSSTSSTPVVAVAAAGTTTSSSSTATATASSAAAAVPSSGGSSGSSGASSYEGFACSKKSRKNKRATNAQIAYAGNTGCAGYGSNVKLIQDSIASKYTYVVKAVNSASSTVQCKVWNKIGPDGGINGFFSGNEALSFTIGGGGSQYVAFDSNTQGGMCCSVGSVPLTSVGEFSCPWLEFDFGDSANGGWSGFDASALVAGATGGSFKALKACTADGSVCSTLYEGGGGSNAYLPGDEALDGIGGNLAPGSVSLVGTW